MKRKIITTADGSKTIQIEDWNEQYHSIHGALNEARHVFIKHALLHFYQGLISEFKKEPVSILEIGFGTGLNAFLTLLESMDQDFPVSYVGVEAYPVSLEEIALLNYADLISKAHSYLFEKMHSCEWELNEEIINQFILQKQKKYFHDIKDVNQFDIIYFDAFGARVQPELWTKEVFHKMFKALKPGGILSTYAAKGSVRRAMQEVGFLVERLPGPPGKREMLRATKSS